MTKFLRPTFFTVAAFVLCLIVNELFFRGPVESRQPDAKASTGEKLPVEANGDSQGNSLRSISSGSYPDPSLSPADVVRIQLHALRMPNREEGVRRCFEFASPANQALTGPAKRFGTLLENPPYSILLEAEDAILGAPILLDDGRVQIVATVISRTEAQSFAWTLAKQAKHPLENCWMTDSVVSVSKDTTSTSKIEI